MRTDHVDTSDHKFSNRFSTAKIYCSCKPARKHPSDQPLRKGDSHESVHYSNAQLPIKLNCYLSDTETLDGRLLFAIPKKGAHQLTSSPSILTFT